MQLNKKNYTLAYFMTYSHFLKLSVKWGFRSEKKGKNKDDVKKF